MKKLLIALAFASTQVMGAGTVYEQGIDTPKTLNCTPPTTRAPDSQGVEAPITGTLSTIITTKNTTTSITEVANADATCTQIYDFDVLTPGQYEVTAQAVEESLFTRESVSSETFYFLVQPQQMPPNAPTGLQLQ